MIIDELLKKEPYKLKSLEKEALFLNSMKESFQHHYDNCQYFKKYIDFQKFNLASVKKIDGFPYLPVSIFKELKLITGPEDNIKTSILSSATTSNKPSQVFLDDISIKRQQIALRNIISEYLGRERLVFIIWDAKATAQKDYQYTSSRASAIRGFAQFAKSMNFILNSNLKFDPHLLSQAIELIKPEDKICFLGFTWLIYKTYLSIKENSERFLLIRKEIQKLGNDNRLLHLGGWKKLKDMTIEKSKFNSEIGEFLNLKEVEVIDFYGMTEQLGTVYPDCRAGYKHLPLYSDLIIRDMESLESLQLKETGFIQLLTPIPNSYPGISLLTEDLGEIQGIDDCPCGRMGKYFIFKKRLEKAPIKGCGDTL